MVLLSITCEAQAAAPIEWNPGPRLTSLDDVVALLDEFDVNNDGRLQIGQVNARASGEVPASTFAYEGDGDLDGFLTVSEIMTLAAARVPSAGFGNTPPPGLEVGAIVRARLVEAIGLMPFDLEDVTFQPDGCFEGDCLASLEVLSVTPAKDVLLEGQRWAAHSRIELFPGGLGGQGGRRVRQGTLAGPQPILMDTFVVGGRLATANDTRLHVFGVKGDVVSYDPYLGSVSGLETVESKHIAQLVFSPGSISFGNGVVSGHVDRSMSLPAYLRRDREVSFRSDGSIFEFSLNGRHTFTCGSGADRVVDASTAQIMNRSMAPEETVVQLDVAGRLRMVREYFGPSSGISGVFGGREVDTDLCR